MRLPPYVYISETHNVSVSNQNWKNPFVLGLKLPALTQLFVNLSIRDML